MGRQQQGDRAIVAQLEQTIGQKLEERAVYDEQGRAIKLNLSELKLEYVPTEVTQFTFLQNLDLHNNQLTRVPVELDQLSSLQKLYLDTNQLTQVPVELGQLSSLQRLDLDNNQLTKIPIQICHLSKLEILYLSNNPLRQIPMELAQLSNLQELYLDEISLTQLPSELSSLSNLKVLSLEKNQLTQVPMELSQLSSLQELWLSNNQLTQVPVELGQLSSLQKLYLHNNQLTQVPVELGQLSSLQELYLHNNQLTQVPIELGQLSSLQELYLHNNQLTQVPIELGQLSSLQKFWLNNNQLTQVPIELGQLSSLQELWLNNNQLTQVPVELGQLSSLQELYLHNNQLTQVPVELGQPSSLQELWLNNNQLTQVPVELGQLSSLQELYLDNNQLTQVPVELGQLSSLQRLDLDNNQLTQVPVELGQLSSLQKLSLNNNQLTQVPIELGQLSSLQELYLDNNQLTQVPVDLGQLSSLQKLWLNNNQLTQVPVELGQLSSLQRLDLDNNQLTQIPTKICHLPKLEILYLSNNPLTQVPVGLAQLSNLQELYLDEIFLTQIPIELALLSNLKILSLNANKLAQVPVELSQLSNLQELYLSKNKLTQVPLELSQLSNLQLLELEDNSLLTPPPEIITQGTQAILAFLQELQLKSIKRYEAKLILIGEGGTGKSSLLRSLHGKQFDTSLATTHGIEIGTLSLNYLADKMQKLTLNTWDFGGQHIYHTTHRFFLTKRSLYLVVWNARLGVEQGRLNYWLDTIKALAPESPILLIATHIDERAPDLNYQLYKDAYPQLVGTINVSNKYGTDIAILKEKLSSYAATLPLVGQPWPTNWVEVEKALLSRKEHHIDLNRYKRICAVRRIQAKFAQGTLGGYLHDLGKILYFREDYELSNLIVLKPNWVTKAISLVLEDESVREAHGILEHIALPRIWAIDEDGKPYESHLYPIFLRLMEKFDLSYQINSEIPGELPTHSLVPQLLPHQPPPDLLDWPNSPLQGQAYLQMIYCFDFVPSGLMSWFIVRTHRYSIDKHWREGVLLTYQGHFARVELNPIRRELRLFVWGVQPLNFFTILKNTLDLILKRFEGLRMKCEVPCICHWETKSDKPCTEFYRYEEDLVRRLEKGKLTIECPESLGQVSIPTLLYGIHVSTVPQVHDSIEASKQEFLQHFHTLEYNDERILRKIEETNQLVEWSVRNFTRLWNQQMHSLEAECPNTFILVANSRTPFNPKNWISQNYKLCLMCQNPSGPHCIPNDPGYDFRQPKEWWTKIAPWLKHLTTFLKYGVPFMEIAGAVIDATDLKNLEMEIGLLKNISDDLPGLVESSSSQPDNRPSIREGKDEAVGPALRVLYNFLKDIDPHQHWAGLQKVTTPDDNILWLCAYHAHPYKVPMLQLDEHKK